MTRLPSLAACLLAATVVLPAIGQDSEADHVSHRHDSVRISRARLHPEVLTLARGDALAWLNYSAKFARVSFDADVAKRMRCNQASSFSLDGDRLVSRRIAGNGYAALCQLEPGEYAYRVDLLSAAGTSGGGVERSLEGRIVVE